MSNVEETYDVVVIGAGHAGCEAALASARLPACKTHERSPAPLTSALLLESQT